ncbi:hypothetical protein AAG570_001560 [Ranatra chinensis]|uniref:Amine oxidase domain-containing protein n=1 Tax=Ranatra chinensis TaxID=642074 RepID=A0ABD0YMX2_9HEMI
MAGMSVAQGLLHCGHTNFKILEATERPGGRIHSALMDNRAVIEFGAQWIKGASMANSVFCLACQSGARLDPEECVRRPADVTRLVCFTSEGRQVEANVAAKAYQMWERLERQARFLFATRVGRGQGTLWNYLVERADSELSYVPDDCRGDVSRVIYGCLNAMRCRWGADLRNMSATHYGSHRSLPGHQVMLPTGMINVLSPLFEKIPKENIVFGKAVENITWGGAGVAVKTHDGQEYCCDQVVVTFSLGVLKERAGTLFCPQLPECKTDAVRRLGWGHIGKVFLDYDRPFWPPRDYPIRFCWSKDELSEQDCSWARSVAVMEQQPGSPSTLVGVVGGAGALAMELCTEDQVAETMTLQLRKFTGDDGIPYPTNLARTKWGQDPYFLGANSYLALGSSDDDQRELASPVAGSSGPRDYKILFAGEATVPTHFGTLHGARISGMREAERILKMAYEKTMEAS